MSDFSTSAEIQKYLLKTDGRKVSTDIGDENLVVGYKEGTLFNYSNNTPSFQSFEAPETWKKYLGGWEADIPDIGILCKTPDREYSVTIIEYEEDSNYPYLSEDDSFPEVTPLTDREIIEYLSDKKLVAYVTQYLNNKDKDNN